MMLTLAVVSGGLVTILCYSEICSLIKYEREIKTSINNLKNRPRKILY